MDAIIMTDTGAHNRKRSASTISNGQLPTPSISPLGSPLFRGLEPNGEVHSLVGKAILVNGPGTTYSPNAVPPEEDMLPLDRPAETVLPQATRRPSQDAVSKRRTSTSRATSPTAGGEILKLSPAKIQELTASPESLPVRAATPLAEHPSQRLPSLLRSEEVDNADENKANVIAVDNLGKNGVGRLASGHVHSHGVESSPLPPGNIDEQKAPQTAMGTMSTETNVGRPFGLSRTLSTPPNVRRKSWSKTHSALQQSLNHNKGEKSIPPPLNLREIKNTSTNGNAIHPKVQSAVPTMASPMPTSIPLPPMSIPTYLQLELSSERPSPLYIHRSSAAEFPYETSAVKFERLLNFLLLPPELEYVLGFGAFACLDAFLYVFTILPLRFFKAITILTEWALENVAREGRDIGGFIYRGIPRLWTRQRGRQRASSIPKKELEKLQLQRATTSQSTEMGSESSGKSIANGSAAFDQVRKRSRTSSTKHRRMRSTPSTLASTHKADLLKGLLVVVSCAILLRFDASRMYHSIRGQAAIKLYVIYNVLEVSVPRKDLLPITHSSIQVADRLLSAIGQDVLECLFSDEVLDRDADGRSKIIRPLWMFLLALFYNVVHATALFYQCITLNVAVNSYSNALLTLLMSNQFVEIKGTVFKKFEKENLFQITCADIVERFQLWLMLTVIALRNLVEMGSLSISLSTVLGTASTSSPGSNATAAPLTSANILPKAFTVLPNWAGEVLGPFLIVLGSEMLVDWLKHAYIGKFNNTKPDIYGRFLDVIAKDYYSHVSLACKFQQPNNPPLTSLPRLSLSKTLQSASVSRYCH